MKLETIQAELAKTQAELAKTNEKARDLARRMEEEQTKLIKQLPAIAGFKSIDELVLALTPHASSSLRLRLRLDKDALGVGKRAKLPHNELRGSIGGLKRERFPQELMDRIKGEMQAGEKTMAQIAAEYGPAPSIHTLRIWKRKWKLTRNSRHAGWEGE